MSSRSIFLFLALSSVFANSQESLKKYLLEPAARSSLREIHFNAAGELYLIRGSGEIEKYDKDLDLLWRRSLIEEPLAVYPAGVALRANGGILVGGVTANEGREAFVLDISADGDRTEVLASFSDLNINDVEISPEGRIFLVGNRVRAINRWLGRRSDKDIHLLLDLIHELGEGGEVVRSFAPQRVILSSEDSSLQTLGRMSHTRLRFSPEGIPYVFAPPEPVLRRLDPDSWATTGLISLPFAGPAAQVSIRDIQFLSEEEIFYRVVKSAATGEILGHEMRTLVFSTGDSIRQLELDPSLFHLGLVGPDASLRVIEFSESGRVQLKEQLPLIGGEARRRDVQ